MAFVAALATLGRRGSWLLIGAPLALFWIGVAVMLAQSIAACVRDRPQGAKMSCLP